MISLAPPLMPVLAAADAAPSPVGTVALSILVVGLLGAVFGIILFVASKKFAVKTDPRVEEVLGALPGANCGACGLAGCPAYAEGVVLKGLAVNLCAPGGAKAAKMIAAVMGVEPGESERRVSVLRCRGSRARAKERMEYRGVADCRAAALVLGGPKACTYGCLGLGTCVEACPFGAIVMGADGLPHVLEARCTACGRCVDACPRHLYVLAPEKRTVHVLCSSRDPGRATRAACEVGCIACKACERACKFDAIHVVDNLAVIDEEKCKNCGACVRACPQAIIGDFRKMRKALAASARSATNAGGEAAAS